jgi:hypothetical protein
MRARAAAHVDSTFAASRPISSANQDELSCVAPRAREAMRRDRACELRCGGGSARFVFRGEPFHRAGGVYGLGGLRLAALPGCF